MHQNAPETSDDTTINDVLQQGSPEVIIRSNHPAIDRLLVFEAAAKKSGGKKLPTRGHIKSPKPKKSEK